MILSSLSIMATPLRVGQCRTFFRPARLRLEQVRLRGPKTGYPLILLSAPSRQPTHNHAMPKPYRSKVVGIELSSRCHM